MNRGSFSVLSITLLTLLILEKLDILTGVNIAVYNHIPPTTSFLVKMVTNSASFGVFLIYIVLFMFLDFKRVRRITKLTLEFILALAVGMAIVGVLKVSTGVPRPNEVALNLPLYQMLLNVDYFAFPSGHTTRASIFAYFLSKRFPNYKPLWWSYAFLVALSRLLLQVHWLSDVLFALLLGVWVSMLVELTENIWLPIYSSVMEKLKLEVFKIE
ncbi:phosphatase PAP2 family protein [Thermococcus paralvinellae]|uniref:Membrane-associated phosphatase n=1 Tax=Thermococcus paralvinellae TaxID=582419 RepID=W0I5V7_9EURY|nr:phosphatase PAP2 family protein [Thermococcus paralvinellae]AHF80127.1 membrane-associated phosphatase [Thermococcus paralvinellae]